MRIEAIEHSLLELAERLDQPFRPRGAPDSVAMALGHRVRCLYRGYLTCTASGLHAAARLLLRPMVEANILLRWIRDEPEWRTRLWRAESTRVWAGLADQLHQRPLPPEQDLSQLLTRQEIERLRQGLEELRAEALGAGVHVPPRGRLIPNVQEQVQILNTPEAWQAYVTAYMPLTLDQHVSEGSFAAADEEVLADSRVIHHPQAIAPRFSERLLASGVFASTLVIVSAWLGLGIEDRGPTAR